MHLDHDAWDLPIPAILKPARLWTGKQVLSMYLPPIDQHAFAKRHPEDEDELSPSDTRIVIEHLASVGIADPPYREFEAALKSARCGNIAIKVPGLAEICPRPPLLAPEFRFDNVPPLFEMTRDAFGVQRMMWGSDFPPSAGREGYENTLEGVRGHPAFSGPGDAEWVMGKAAAQWWGFDELEE